MANILEAIYRIIENPITQVGDFYRSRNRINSTGEALEKYIKDVFANTFNENNEVRRDEIYSQVFSYLGNQNNPPDLILQNGDAVEIKKIENANASLALNSSYPKSKLRSDNPLILAACRDCENTPWLEKDIVYIVGYSLGRTLKYLWIVYGDCIAANRNVYERIRQTIANGINNIPEVEFSQTRELGRVNRVDPLGITSLRIRGVWHISNPRNIFEYLVPLNYSTFQVNVLMRIEKFNSFPANDKNLLLDFKNLNYNISSVNFKNPDNPAQFLQGKLITYKI